MHNAAMVSRLSQRAPLLLVVIVLGLFPAVAAADEGDGGSKDRDESSLADKPIGAGSCAKRVRELKELLADLSYLPRANGSCMKEEEGFALTAFQKQEGIKVDGKADRKTLKRLVKAKTPDPGRGGDSDRLIVSLKRQVLYIIQGDEVKRTIAIASGRAGFSTPRGRYKIYRKERNSYSNEFNVNLPWASYFVRGIAFHSSNDVARRPASHGCIRVPPPFAREVYRDAPLGRQVVVF